MQSGAATSVQPESSSPVPAPVARAKLHRAIVVVNERAGTAGPVHDALPQLEQMLRAAHREVATHFVEPRRVRDFIEAKLGREPTLVVVGGGDGTLRVAAGVLAGTEHVLGILPLGTMNRFARSLGIPLELDEAVATLATGVDQRVDIGEVNGEVFLNTCMLGVYPEIVRLREQRRTPRFRRGKSPAANVASLSACSSMVARCRTAFRRCWSPIIHSPKLSGAALSIEDCSRSTCRRLRARSIS